MNVGWLMGVAATVVGCAPTGACEPEIVTDNAEQRALIAQTYAEMASEVTLPLCARRIEVVDQIEPTDDFPAHRLGRMQTPSFHVELANVDAQIMRWTLRHELCHALSVQHGLSRRSPLEGSPAAVEEAYALRCELGAMATDVLTRSERLPPEEQSALEQLQHNLWPPAPPPTPLPRMAVSPVAWPVAPDRRFAGFVPEGEPRDDWLVLYGERDDGWTSACYILNPNTGEELHFDDLDFAHSGRVDEGEPRLQEDWVDQSTWVATRQAYEAGDWRVFELKVNLGQATYVGVVVEQEGTAPTWLPSAADPTLSQWLWDLRRRRDGHLFQVATDPDQNIFAVASWEL